jgi:flagellar basal-body rod protein FlgB
MDYSNIALFQLMGVKMDYGSQRQAVLSKNIANIDTPGYRAEDLKPLDFDNLAKAASHRLEMHTTSPMHIAYGSVKSGPYDVVQQRKTYETTPVKNNVVLEEQMMKVAGNQSDYQMTTQLYRKMIDIMRNTVSGGR